MSKNIGFGHVFTDRPSFNKNCGCGLYDSSKVAYVEDSNGKVYVDGTLCKIVKYKELDLIQPLLELHNEVFDGTRDPIYTDFDLFADMDEWTLFFDGILFDNQESSCYLVNASGNLGGHLHNIFFGTYYTHKGVISSVINASIMPIPYQKCTYDNEYKIAFRRSNAEEYIQYTKDGIKWNNTPLKNVTYNKFPNRNLCIGGLKNDDKGHGNLISLKLFDKGEIDVANLFQ